LEKEKITSGESPITPAEKNQKKKKGRDTTKLRPHPEGQKENVLMRTAHSEGGNNGKRNTGL